MSLKNEYSDLKARNQNFKKALDAISHRGPDDKGIFENKWGKFGHTRLSIIDLTNDAHQPMLDESSNYLIVFNGEIYNYLDLYKRFFSDDVTVNRNSDTSVLLGMYKKYHHKCLDYLDGMFSFVILDIQNNELFAARDRFGEKPLYIYQDNDLVVLSSEIRAIRKLLPKKNFDIDYNSLVEYHTIGSVPPPKTIYKHIKSLEPGHYLNIDHRGSIKNTCYWNLSDKKLQDKYARIAPKNYNEAVEHTKFLLNKSIKSRFISDVPVGVFLSGGIDSGAIASISNPNTNALCIDFLENEYSEYGAAKLMSEKYGLSLERHIIDSDFFTDNLEGFFASSDQPTIDGFNTYFVSMIAKSMNIKVWLSGVGGDELFGGYPSFQKINQMKNISSLLQKIQPQKFPKFLAREISHNSILLRSSFMGIAGNPYLRAHQALRSIQSPFSVTKILKNICIPDNKLINQLDKKYLKNIHIENLDRFQICSIMESNIYMSSQLLRDIDNYSMAHSIEIRSPFLDHNLFESVFYLDKKFKQMKGRNKPLLVDALESPLPSRIINSPKKGFTFPIEIWLKEAMDVSFRDYVLSPENEKFWNLDQVEELWELYKSGKMHWSVVWSYYFFARWHRSQNVDL
jgi:asparagine synthase (glutamine-hydrolysing)